MDATNQAANCWIAGGEPDDQRETYLLCPAPAGRCGVRRRLSAAEPAHRGSVAALADSDRGQARELYLSLVEQVPLELRTTFLKIYAYY